MKNTAATKGTEMTFQNGQRVSHYTKPVVGGQGTIVEAGKVLSIVKWDKTGITRSVPNSHLQPAL